MEMQRLNPLMMSRYEIEAHRPAGVNCVQFGMGEALLGAVDRLIDASGAGVGIACVEAGEAGYAARLRAQGGLYTVIVRGYAAEEAVRREEVVQCVLEAHGADALPALAERPELALAIVDDTPEARALWAQFAELRRSAGLDALPALRLGDELLADALVFRAEADEAARECREMNYLDDMLHLAEPCARLTIRADAALRARFPLDRAAGVRFADAEAFERERTLVRRVFDGGLCLMAAAGWLNGCETLRDCMQHERLRRFVGGAFTGELMPSLCDVDRRALEDRVIESFGRYENPLNRVRVLRASEGLLGRFAGQLDWMRAWADEHFEPPRSMAFALAATIMLYAGARPDPETGRYLVARGNQTEVLRDDPEKLAVFAALSHDMPPESLAYAALADRELWGADLRDIDGLEARVALDLAAMQRDPGFILGY